MAYRLQFTDDAKARPTIDGLSVRIQRRSRVVVKGSSANVIRKHRDAR